MSIAATLSSERMDLVTCTRCKVAQPGGLEHFHANAKKRNGLASWCRGCHREIAREQQRRRRADPVEHERVKEEKRRYMQTERGREWKRRAALIDNQRRRQEGHPRARWEWSFVAWERCLEAFGFACAYCGATDLRLVHDHFIPLSDPECPGAVPENIVPACDPCNGAKHMKRGEGWASPAALCRIRRYFGEVSR